MPLTDADIMIRVQDGDRDVFGLLVTRYAARLLRVAQSKTGDVALAEDLVQETFLAAFKARSTYDANFAVSTWLWTILLNLCRRDWKRSQSRSRSERKRWCALSAEDQTPDALTLLIRKEDQQQLHSWLKELPETQADALRLRFFGELSFDEIASTMNCSLSGAKRRVKTGLERLSVRIRSRKSSDTPDAVGLRKEDEE